MPESRQLQLDRAYWKGKRVELHPGTDAWMRGNRFGEVIGVRSKPGGGIYLDVKMDKTRKVYHLLPDLVTEANPGKPDPLVPLYATVTWPGQPKPLADSYVSSRRWDAKSKAWLYTVSIPMPGGGRSEIFILEGRLSQVNAGDSRKRRLHRQLRPDLFPPAPPRKKLTLKRGAEKRTKGNPVKLTVADLDRMVELVESARRAWATYGKSDLSGFFAHRFSAADRETFDRWVVWQKLPMAFEAGTTERRFLRLLNDLGPWTPEEENPRPGPDDFGAGGTCSWCQSEYGPTGHRTRQLSPAEFEAFSKAGSHGICRACRDEMRSEIAKAKGGESNPTGDREAAFRMAEDFHDQAPKVRSRKIEIRWPRTAIVHLGPCARIDYVSSKFDGKRRRYFHEFQDCQLYAAANPQPGGRSLLILTGKFKVKPEGLTG